VQSRRPAGSVFKPLVYSVALEKGMTPDSLIRDEPLSVRGRDGKPWQPKNFSGDFHGPVSLTTALVHSYNIPAIRVMQKTGIKPVHRLAEASGISAELPQDLSLALGAADVSLLEMTGAYQPYTCRGSFTQPTLISKITGANGQMLYQAKALQKQVLTEKSSEQVRFMLTEVIRSGTGRNAAGLPGVSGGKTGTSDDNRDAWFIGFRQNLLTGVWFGYDRNHSLGSTENGGRTAAPVWHDFMKSAR
jgi:penicillin-binding protein 1A